MWKTNAQMFGSDTFGFGSFGQQRKATGTAHVKYSPVPGSEVTVKRGISRLESIKYNCITVMQEYENKSLEELRLEDYTAGRKGLSTAGVFGSQQAQQKPLWFPTSAGLLGAMKTESSAFGTTTPTFGSSTTPSLGTRTTPTCTSTKPTFGTSTAPTFGTSTTPTSGASPTPTFGTSTTPTFGTRTTSTSTSTTPTFGTSTAPTFGTSTTPTFGTNTAPTFGFGSNTQNQTGGLFGAKPASTGSGTTPASSGFGGFGTGGGLFGAKPATTGIGTGEGLFGARPATTGFGTGEGLFGAKPATTGFGTGDGLFGAKPATTGFGTGEGLFGAKAATPCFGATSASSGSGGFGTGGGLFHAKPQPTTAPTFASTRTTPVFSGLGTGRFGTSTSGGKSTAATQTDFESNAPTPQLETTNTAKENPENSKPEEGIATVISKLVSTDDKLDNIFGEQMEARLTLREITQKTRNIDKKLQSLLLDNKIDKGQDTDELEVQLKEYKEKLDSTNLKFENQRKELDEFKEKYIQSQDKFIKYMMQMKQELEKKAVLQSEVEEREKKLQLKCDCYEEKLTQKDMKIKLLESELETLRTNTEQEVKPEIEENKELDIGSLTIAKPSITKTEQAIQDTRIQRLKEFLKTERRQYINWDREVIPTHLLVSSRFLEYAADAELEIQVAEQIILLSERRRFPENGKYLNIANYISDFKLDEYDVLKKLSKRLRYSYDYDTHNMSSAEIEEVIQLIKDFELKLDSVYLLDRESFEKIYNLTWTYGFLKADDENSESGFYVNWWMRKSSNQLFVPSNILELEDFEKKLYLNKMRKDMSCTIRLDYSTRFPDNECYFDIYNYVLKSKNGEHVKCMEKSLGEIVLYPSTDDMSAIDFNEIIKLINDHKLNLNTVDLIDRTSFEIKNNLIWFYISEIKKIFETKQIQ